eukprot:2478253-Pleurochrysis_carterae.AAC.1
MTFDFLFSQGKYFCRLRLPLHLVRLVYFYCSRLVEEKRGAWGFGCWAASSIMPNKVFSEKFFQPQSSWMFN